MSLNLFFDVLLHVVVIFLAVQVFQLNRQVRYTRMVLHTIGGVVDEEIDDLCDYVKSMEEKIERLEGRLPLQEL